VKSETKDKQKVTKSNIKGKYLMYT